MTPPLVIFPGWSLGPSSYRLLVTELSNRRVVFVPYVDMVAKSGIGSLARGVKHLLGSADKSVVVGHSLGGILAMDFVASYPEQVKHLFLANSAGSIHTLSFPRVVKGFVQNNLYYASVARLEQLRSFSRVVSHLPTQTQLAKHAFRFDAIPTAQKIRVPTGILYGDADRLINTDAAERLHTAIPQSTFEVLKGEGHDWITYSPQYLLKHIRAL